MLPTSPTGRRSLGACALVALVLSALLLPLSAPAAAAPQGRLLVELASPADAEAVAEAVGATLLFADAESGVAVVAGGDAARLARDPRVRGVEPDGRVTAATASWDTASWDTASWDTASWDTASWDTASWDTASWDTASWDATKWDRASWDGADGDGPPGLPWGLAAIRAPQAWQAGAPVAERIVCIVDGGVDAAHPLLADRLWRDAQGRHGVDLLRGDDAPDDEGGHGTHLAGIVAAREHGSGFQGVGPAQVAAVKILGPDGTGLTSDLVAGIAWCRDAGAHVLLLALTEDAPTKALRAAVRGAQRDGMLVVASAGNAGPCDGCVSHPAAYPGVLGVGALAPDLSVAPFSSAGPEVDLAAPGVAIVSTYPGGDLRVGSGTSQAAAFAAGAAAYLWGAHPDWEAGRVARALEHAADDLGKPGRDAATGRGLLDLGLAVEMAR